MTIHRDRFNFSFDHPTLPNYVVKITNEANEADARLSFYILHGAHAGPVVWLERYVS
jgi:hypothetical protein